MLSIIALLLLINQKSNAIGAVVEDGVCGPVDIAVQSTGAQTWQAPKSRMEQGKDCLYRFNIAGAAKVVKLTFSKFQIGSEPSGGAECAKPFVTFKGVMDDVETPIATWCGNKDTQVIVSTGKSLIVTLHGANGIDAESMIAQYEAVEDTACKSKSIEAKSAEALQFPKDTLNLQKVCVYKITAEKGEVVQLTLDPFKVGANVSKCATPFVRLESVIDGAENQVTDVCGETSPQTYQSTGQTMIVTLFGNEDVEVDAVTATPKAAVEDRCGTKDFVASSADYTSWKAPIKDLIKDEDCGYTITAQPNEIVELKFKTFKVGTKQQGCAKPYVKVENVDGDASTEIVKLCGEEIPQPITSTSQKLRVTLIGTAAVTADAFEGQYKSIQQSTPIDDPICGKQTLTATSDSSKLTAPLKDMTADHDCKYVIQQENDRPVQIEFESFNVGVEASTCVKPYVKIEQQVGTETKEIGTACGSQSSLSFKTDGTMIVTLHGTNNVKKDSFTAVYKSGSKPAEQMLLLTTSLAILISKAFS